VRLFLALLGVVAACLLGACGSSPSDLGCSGFSLSDWRKSSSADVSGAKALARCGVLLGKSQDQVKNVLGKTTIYRLRGGRSQMGWGMDPGFLGDDTAYLTLDFNPQGIVERIQFERPNGDERITSGSRASVTGGE
jgi:hypothetical protein